MADLATLRIKSPYGIESIMSLSLSVKPNEHAVMRLSGYCNEEAGFKPLVSRSCENDTVDLYEEGADGKKLLFRGLARDIEMSLEGGIYRIDLVVYSHSVLLDEEKKSRSFQDTEMTYDALFRAVSEETGILIHKKESDEKIKTPATRYKETDFEFLSRMASRLNTSVYPDILTPNLHIGLPKGAREDIGSSLGYGMNKDIERYMREKANGADLNDMDLVSLTISDRKPRRVGDVLVFKGRPFGIIALSAELVRGELIYTYTLAEESYIYSEEKPSPLKGLSLEGKVIERQGETVKLHLDIDDTQDKEKAHFYPYAPITGRAMYSMPIVGEKVRLYFPDGREENAFVQDCVRNNGDTCENTADPSVRYFRTEYGPELMMAPKKLHFKETKPSVPWLYLEIDDDFGIRLKSHKNINIKASGHIGIKAGGAVRFSAPALVRFNQMPAQNGRANVPALPESSFSYENDTHMSAKETYYIGAESVAYVPFAATTNSSERSFGHASPSEKKGFNWGGLLVAVAAVAMVALSVATFGLGAVVGSALICAGIGAACSVGGTFVGDVLSGQWSSPETYLNNAISGGVAGLICGAVLGPAAAGIGGSAVLGIFGEAGAGITAGTMAKGMLLFGTWSGLDNSIRQMMEGRSDVSETVEAFVNGSVVGGAFAIAGRVAGGMKSSASPRLEAETKPIMETVGSTEKTNPNNVKVNAGQQDKHIFGTNNYNQSVASGVNRSILKEDPQQLLDDFAGTGQTIGANKERVDFGRVIGQYYDAKTSTYLDTTRGMIHYDSKGGAHIIPSAPNEY
jgi:hypothetical protein